MTEEDYAAWRDSAMTRWFMAALAETADVNEALAKGKLWAAAMAGQASSVSSEEMNVLGAKAKAYREIVGASFETIQSFHEEAE